ncbi:MAG: hypothetical protein LAN70_13295 [Acidobacteriia bacterium]|nr:hypothetical protein [Terriglobia bacterium]
MKWQLHLGLTGMLCLTACGTPGAPRPPSLELPHPVTDLAATRQGDKVTLIWTAPRETTDKQNIRHPGPVRICRGVNTTAMVQCPQVAELPAVPAVAKGAKPEQRVYADTLPMDLQQQNLTGFATYALESLNARGRSAGLSNQVEVPLAPTLEPLGSVEANVTSDAVVLRWTGYGVAARRSANLSFAYHVFRRAEGGGDVDLGPAMAEAPEINMARKQFAFSDTNFEWEKTYFYRVVAITTVTRPGGTQVEVPGEPTPEAKVVTHDVFPPAAPAGLQAVASGVGQPPFVDLTWAPNTEADLAGYNVYRRQADQPPVKVNNELVKAPAYRDREVTSGHQYFYAVTAVDLRGNESPRSDETSERVP